MKQGRKNVSKFRSTPGHGQRSGQKTRAPALVFTTTWCGVQPPSPRGYAAPSHCQASCYPAHPPSATSFRRQRIASTTRTAFPHAGAKKPRRVPLLPQQQKRTVANSRGQASGSRTAIQHQPLGAIMWATGTKTRPLIGRDSVRLPEESRRGRLGGRRTDTASIPRRRSGA